MTEPEIPDVPDFDDVSHTEIRALLADVAATGPMPTDVADELDDLLANLVAERAAAADDTVVPIRRARVARRLLVAAAAVVLVGAGGIGINQVLHGTNAANDSTAGSGTVSDLAAEAPGATSGALEKAPTDQASGRGPIDDSSYLDRAYANLRLHAEFTRDRFAQQVKGLVANATGTGPFNDLGQPADPDAPMPESVGPTDPDDTSGTLDTRPSTSDVWLQRLSDSKAPHCPGPPATNGVIVVPITFDGRSATLAVHPVAGGSRYVAAWSCDGHRLLAYTTVPG